MSWIDWVIVLVPLIFVLGLGVYSKRYVRSVADFLVAGRVCGRYVICVGDIANMLSILGLAAYIEVHYKTGFALAFWSRVLGPLGLFLGLFGYCIYRFRETKAMSMGQFLEMRYSRRFRIFASALRSVSEILANMIMPAIAARFFIYFLDLPQYIGLLGLQVPTFVLLVGIFMTISISLICVGGTLTLVVTDAIQGMICYPIMAIFVIFILVNFSWSREVVPVMLDRVSGESFLNPFDISKLRDFNLFFLVFMVVNSIMHRASWIGAGTSGAAKSAHEQKMAGLLGSFRGNMNAVFYVLIAVAILTFMNHARFTGEAHQVRTEITARIADELVDDIPTQENLTSRIAAIQPKVHNIGVDPKLSQEANLDAPYLDVAKATLLEGSESKGEGNAKYQEFRTLYHQLMLAVSMRHLLPVGLLGAFCLLMVLAMISTDDTRIFSSALTIMQDVVLPLRKKPFTPRQHIRTIRWIAVGIGCFFLIASTYMAQLDYIQLFMTIMVSLWMGGCGPVMVFGLYSRFGTTLGAWASLLSGMFLSFGSILVQRNWASHVCPWLERMGWDDNLGRLLVRVSAPFNPYIVWKMDPVKFPINSYEISFMIMMVTLLLYVVVSKLTCKEPFNLDRMLHRGKYNLDHENKEREPWTWRNVLHKLVGITPDYTRGDRFLAWALFGYSLVFGFIVMFVGVAIWNVISPWPVEWWGAYFWITALVIPGCVAAVMTVVIGVGGVIDLRRLFRDLNERLENDLDDGRVDGHVSLADKAIIETIDHAGEAGEHKE